MSSNFICGQCGSGDDRICDSRQNQPGDPIRRRRECKSCGHRFNTVEITQEAYAEMTGKTVPVPVRTNTASPKHKPRKRAARVKPQQSDDDKTRLIIDRVVSDYNAEGGTYRDMVEILSALDGIGYSGKIAASTLGVDASTLRRIKRYVSQGVLNEQHTA